jgi:hypothetical protein
MTSKQLANVKHYKHLSSLKTEYEKRTREIKSRNFVDKNELNTKDILCTNKLVLNLKKDLFK